MAKKNEFGKYILSAGEIATFVVCPKAWLLSQSKPIVNNNEENLSRVKQGFEIHKHWNKSFQEAVYYTRSIVLLLILLSITILFLLINYTEK